MVRCLALCFQNGTVLSKWHCAFKMALCFQNGTVLSKWHCAFKMALCFQNGTVLFKWHCAFKMALCNQNNCGWSKTWACGVCAAVLAASRNKYGHICRVGQNRVCTSHMYVTYVRHNTSHMYVTIRHICTSHTSYMTVYSVISSNNVYTPYRYMGIGLWVYIYVYRVYSIYTSWDKF